ncbi:MAG: oligosaccharide flippase family protein [Bacteroidota bacterium]|nr:oligosaccharide flippase family protein [Bacteroidota bacterium]
MRRKFFTNLTLLLFLNLLIKPFWIFGIDRTVQNVVGAEEYGLYFSLFNFSLLLNILLDLGITNYNNRNIAQNNHLLSKSLSSIVSLRLLLALLYTSVTIVAALFVGYEGRQFYLLIFLIFNQFVASFILYLRSNLSGLHYFKTDSIISVLDRFIMIVICGLLLWGGVTENPFKIEWFVYAQTAAYLFTLVLSLGIVYGKAQFLKLKFDRTYFIAILKKSYPFALLSLLMAFYYRIDSVMLERMLPDGKEQAGIYAQGFRILDAAAMFAFLYAGLLLPMFSRMIKQKKSIHQLTLFSFLLLIVPVVGITFASYFYRTELIDMLYHHHVDTSATIFGILILCFLGISTSYIFGTLLTANGNLRQLNFMAVGGVIVNITLNFILIPKFYALGSAIASLVTQTFVAILQVLLAKKIFQFSIDLKRIAIFVLFIGGVLLFSMFSVDLDFNWVYKFIAILVFTMILAFLLRLIHLKVLVDLLKNGDEI